MENLSSAEEIAAIAADIAARRWNLVTENDRKRRQKT